MLMSAARNLVLVWAVTFFLLPIAIAAAANNSTDKNGVNAPRYRFDIEYLYPTEESRDIQTINLNVYRRIGEFRPVRLTIHAGITATYASGDITQLEGELDQGTLREVNYENEAAGIGPSLLADLCFFNLGSFSFHFAGIGSILLYDKQFPAGGDRYNFMWRGGVFMHCAIGKNQEVGLGYLWMHVSNGQGMGSHNPSYDAQGMNLTFSFTF
jgi:lipid A 3-O-deacylase